MSARNEPGLLVSDAHATETILSRGMPSSARLTPAARSEAGVGPGYRMNSHSEVRAHPFAQPPLAARVKSSRRERTRLRRTRVLTRSERDLSYTGAP